MASPLAVHVESLPACFGRERRCEFPRGRWAWESRGRRAGSGSGPDTSQTPEDPFSPTQSCGVWEVHGAIVIGPEPEQMIDGRVVQRRPRGKPAEFPSVLVEGEISAGYGEDASGSLHGCGKKMGNKKLSKKRENKRRKEALLTVLLGPLFCHTSRGTGRRGNEETWSSGT